MSVFVRIEGLDPEELDAADAHELAYRLFADIYEDYPGLYEGLSGVIPVLDEEEHARLVEVSNIERPTDADRAADPPTVSFGPLDRDDLEHVGDASDLDADEWDWVDACGHAYVRVEDDEQDVMTDGGRPRPESGPYRCGHCDETSPDPSTTSLPCGCVRVTCPNCGKTDELHETFCRADEVVTDGGMFDCGDCGEETAADDVTGLIQPDGDGAKLLCPDCQPNHPYDRQYDPAALLDEDGDAR